MPVHQEEREGGRDAKDQPGMNRPCVLSLGRQPCDPATTAVSLVTQDRHTPLLHLLERKDDSAGEAATKAMLQLMLETREPG